MVSHRRSKQPRLPGSTTVLTAAAATAAAAVAVASGASAEPRDPAQLKVTVERLYQQAEAATEQYNGAQERERDLRQKVGNLQDEVARGQQRLIRMRRTIGGLASAEYRSGGIRPGAQLLLSSEPDNYLGRASVLNRISAIQAGQLRRVVRAKDELDHRRTEAAARLAELERTRRALAEHKRAIRARLARAHQLLDSLGARQRAELGMSPGWASPAVSGRAPATPAAMTAGSAGSLPAAGADSAPPTRRAAVAVTAVQRAIGSPYRWAQAGPHAFDCSGLTYWAYQQAGVTIPRTSQGQLHAGRHIPLGRARPGDLVIYRSDASHVGMYAGGGKVIHSPHPGARVRYDPVNMLPIAAVTRV